MQGQNPNHRINMAAYGLLSLGFFLKIASLATAALRYAAAIFITGASPFILWVSRGLSTLCVLAGLMAFFVGAPKEVPLLPWIFLGMGCVLGALPLLLDGLITLLLPSSRSVASRRG